MLRLAFPLLLLAAVLHAERPRLVVVVAVDQLRPDVLARYEGEYTGGLKRLLERGRRFDGVLDHGMTATGPGHATMLTGCRPARVGIIGNTWLDPESLASVYCVEDPEARVHGDRRDGRSPKLMLRDALGDWLQEHDPGAKVLSVAGKDRAAVTMGGRRPTAAYWYERDANGFTTSAYYEPDRPEWLARWTGDELVKDLPEEWKYEPVDSLRADDDPRESPKYGRASPHPLRMRSRRSTLDNLYRTPYLDALTLALAAEVADRHDAGGDAIPDLLCVSLSATDTIGHLYGPFSQEIRDSMLRIDRELGVFLAHLDERTRDYVLVLTADHGVLPLDDMTRLDFRKVAQTLSIAAQKSLGTGDWFRLAENGVYVNRETAREKGVDVAQVAAALAEAARGMDGVEAVFDRAQLAGDGGGELLELCRHSWHPDRSADLVVVTKEGVLVTDWSTGTAHGSPWLYDRAVPIVFAGPGIAPSASAGPARTIDIAPTLAKILGVPPPPDLDGVALALN